MTYAPGDRVVIGQPPPEYKRVKESVPFYGIEGTVLRERQSYGRTRQFRESELFEVLVKLDGYEQNRWFYDYELIPAAWDEDCDQELRAIYAGVFTVGLDNLDIFPSGLMFVRTKRFEYAIFPGDGKDVATMADMAFAMQFVVLSEVGEYHDLDPRLGDAFSVKEGLQR